MEFIEGLALTYIELLKLVLSFKSSVRVFIDRREVGEQVLHSIVQVSRVRT